MPTPASTRPARRPTGQVAWSRVVRPDSAWPSPGCRPRGSIDELDVAALRACLDVSVVGTWLACRSAVAPMRAAGYGPIVTLASALGLVNSGGRRLDRSLNGRLLATAA
jgi:NAD(P)-dependent dehydrogenase (short-subunit alcohol dehydrogenase family)